MKFCIAGRCDGASSTSTASSGIADASACNKYSTAIGSPATGAGGKTRPAGIGRLVSPSRSISRVSAGFIVAMMLVPNGVTAAAVGSSVIWKIAVAPSKIAPVFTFHVEGHAAIFDMKGKHRRADHDHEIMRAKRVRELAGGSMQ